MLSCTASKSQEVDGEEMHVQVEVLWCGSTGNKAVLGAVWGKYEMLVTPTCNMVGVIVGIWRSSHS